jgi:cereblon
MGEGDSAQVYINAFGYLHEIITVRRAQGLRFDGEPTLEFTWFQGYTWQIASCAACRSHIGWRFEAVSEGAALRSFYGLRHSAIVRTTVAE